MYELENISWSWMFLLIVLISIFFIIDRVWKNRTQKSFFSKTNLERLSPNISEIKPILKIVSVIVGVSMLIIALINPKIGTKIETFQRLGVDIVFAIDVSKSMLAEDIKGYCLGFFVTWSKSFTNFFISLFRTTCSQSLV